MANTQDWAAEIDAAGPDDEAAGQEEAGGPEGSLQADDAGTPDDEAGEALADEVAGPYARMAKGEAAMVAQYVAALEKKIGVRLPMAEFSNMLMTLRGSAVKRALPARTSRKLTRRQQLLRNHVLRDFQSRHPGSHLVEDSGVYYSTFEAVFNCEGSANGAIARIARGTSFDAFTTYVAPTSTVLNGSRMGIPYSETPADTNLTQPSMTTYVDQVFHIQRIGLRFKGLRVKYSPADIATMTGAGGNLTSVVDGHTLTFDDDGIVLPTELWNSETNTCEIARAIGAAGVVYFNWTDTGIGNTGASRTVEIDAFDSIPGLGSRDLRVTSGGSGTKDLPGGGYLWTQDNAYQLTESNGGNGLFKATLKVETDTSFCFQPIPVFGSSLPLVPQQIGVEWQVRLYGTGFRTRGGRKHDRPSR